jgi:hypothetical protein
MASFPTSLATNAQLLVALDNAQTTLASGIGSGDTSLTVVSAAAIASDTVVTIDAEQILLGTVVGVNATGCTRGYAGTTPAAHSAGAVVYANVIAAHHNRTRDELIAVQTALGAGMRFTRNTHRTTAYRWTATFAQSLAIGTVTVNFSTGLPDGLNATYSPNQHRLYITDATSGSEEVLVTAIVGTQVTFAVTINHTSGQWTLGTATEGIQEAHYANMGSPLYIPNGEYTVSEIYLTSANAAAENIFSIEGEDWMATKLRARSRTQHFFKWVGSWNISFYTHINVRRINFLNSSLGAYQTAGSCLYFDGHGYVQVEFCRFKSCYDNVNATAVGCFARVTHCSAFNTVNYFVRVTGNLPPGTAYGSTFQIIGNYADGRYKGSAIDPPNEGLSPALISAQGSIGGGMINDNWMQASACHVLLTGLTGRQLSEIQIQSNIFDQDSLSGVTGCVAISNDDSFNVANSSSIMVQGNFINTVGYGVLVQNMTNVMISENRIKTFGVSPGVALATCNRSHVKNNVFVDRILQTLYFVLITNATAGAGDDISVTGNSCYTADESGGGTNVPYFVGIDVTSGDRITVMGNDCQRVTALCDGATTDRTKVVIRGNVIPAYVPATITAAATIAIPFDDDDTITAIDGATAITRITGGQPGMKRQFIAGGTGSLTFNTGGASPGRIAIAKTVAANEPFVAVYYAADAYMRIMKGA